MADLVLSRADLWPAATVVGLYPGRPRASLGAAITTDTVASDGTLTVAEGDMTAGRAYVLAATVAGESRQLGFVRSSSHVERDTWQETVAARRTAIGTS